MVYAAWRLVIGMGFCAPCRGVATVTHHQRKG